MGYWALLGLLHSSVTWLNIKLSILVFVTPLYKLYGFGQSFIMFMMDTVTVCCYHMVSDLVEG